ncbi:cytochrome C oxidase subunit IV family protein [Thiohalorhabdus sp.]|uniref:cytochrome C oxidase subunit IV family protein n=1 Tax=Thiohalorhabdus sp. TaxID=3094134 RepID=UPI002FC37A9D
MEAIRHLSRPGPTAIWLLLLALTGLTYAAGELHLTGPPWVFGVLAIVLVKGRLIAWHYMELARVAPLWRAVLGGWLVAVGGLIAAAFLLSEV